ALPQPERMTLLGHLLAGHELPLRSRVAGVIVLLYAQRVSRIVRLTVDDVIRDGDQVLLRLGEPPSPVPDPFAELLLAWISQRDNMNTATNPESHWLFPGRRAKQPMHPETLARLVNKLGVPTRTARTAAIHQHVLDMPAPVVADALSYHPVTAAKIATHIGATWSRYAPGDHTRTGDS
ncbi:MAG: site-specific integrase, partial [Actinobacteria bacterium]|nr:site-specific integrase [Actinomycetota bacterium]